MTAFEHRHTLVTLINEAVQQGARRKAACDMIGISRRSLLRCLGDGEVFISLLNALFIAY